MKSTASTLERQKRKLDETIDSVSETAHDAVGRVAEQGDQWVEDARDYIRTNPFAAVAGAFAAGYLFCALRRLVR